MNILVADDHVLFRKGLIKILLDEFHELVVHEASNGKEVLSKVRSEEYAIIICDISMPGGDGLETLKQLKEEFPYLPVLILTMHSEEQYAIRAMKVGAKGYITKQSAADELIIAIKYILSGKRYISKELAELIAESFDKNEKKDLHQNLSDREYEVFKLIAMGNSTSEIADILSLSSSTVGTYRQRIFEKMKCKTNAALIHYAINNNLI